jgi:DNA-binding CsgD family transcriptional regulator
LTEGLFERKGPMTTTDTRRVQDRQAGSNAAIDYETSALKRLTPRETEVLVRLRQGKSNRMIAHELGITENTAKVFVRRILMKLHASSGAEVRSHFVEAQRPSDEAIEAFERIVTDMVGGGENEGAVGVLLALIQREIEVLQATIKNEVEGSMRSNARIEQCLNEAADHQAGTDEWLNRLP